MEKSKADMVWGKYEDGLGNQPTKSAIEWSVERQLWVYIFGDDPLDVPISLKAIKINLQNQPYVPTTRMNHHGKLPPALVFKWIEEDLAGVKRNKSFFELRGLAYEEGCAQYDEKGEYCLKRYSEWAIHLDMVRDTTTEKQAIELLENIEPDSKILVSSGSFPDEYLTPQQTIEKLNDYIKKT